MKYLFINTWNGSGYSDSDIEIHDEVSWPLWSDYKNYDEVEFYWNIKEQTKTIRFRYKEDWGCHHYEPLKNDVIAVALFPNVNDWKIITDLETLEKFKALVRKGMIEEGDGDEDNIFGYCAHAVYEDDYDLILCEV